MNERFEAYFEELERLSIDDLDRSAVKLVRVERRSAARLIAHLSEISRRKAELERGYSSLFEYCVKRLNLSEGSVALRIQVANVARRYPRILAALAEGKISLSVAGRLAPHLRDENVEKLLGDCAGMTRREVEEYLVELAPRPVLEPSIRARPAARDGKETPRAGGERAPPVDVSPAGVSGEGESSAAAPAPEEAKAPGSGGSASAPGRLDPARPEVFNFRFAASKEFKDKFTRLAEVLGFENPVRDMAGILERAIDIALERKDPARKLERRIERESRREATGASVTPCPDKDVSPPAPSPAPPMATESATGMSRSRAVPEAMRERVLDRAGYRCEYIGSGGLRCSSRTGLEVEHLRPVAIFRSHDERHLRAYCRRHNRLSAERVYGAVFIRDKIEARRRNAVPGGAELQSG